MDRFYQWLFFEDVFAGGNFVPMAHAGMIPHRVMNCDIAVTKRRWVEVNHPWYPLFFETHHPDIELVPMVVANSSSSPAGDGTTVLSAAGRRAPR